MNALPSPEPNRRKRLALRFAALVAAVSVLGAAYWLTRPPELVWWRSPPLSNTGRNRISVLVPTGWDFTLSSYDGGSGWYEVEPVDQRPRLLSRLFPHAREKADIVVYINQTADELIVHSSPDLIQRRRSRSVHSPDKRVYAFLIYTRSNLPAFNRTYRQICNSLTIE